MKVRLMDHDFSVDALTPGDLWWIMQHQHLTSCAARCRICGLYEVIVSKGGLPRKIYKRSLSSFNPFRSYSEAPPCMEQ